MATSENQSKRVALDIHGGDHGPEVLVPAAFDALRMDPELSIILTGLQADLDRALALPAIKGLESRVQWHACEQVLPADATPSELLRNGAGSSLWQSITQVANGEAGAAVSAANTAALMMLGVKLLKRLAGIKRPALMSNIPLRNGSVGLLDLGANLEVDDTQLVQFAMMGSVVAQQHAESSMPTVGLLNVGHEDSKGHEVVRKAHARLKQSDLNYQGFIEGHSLFEGVVDLAVCDGFTGNLILKASEGLASMLFAELRSSLNANWRSKAGGILAKPALKAMLERLDPAKHNGAPLLGLNGVIIKSHGRSTQRGSCEAILEAGREIERRVPQRIAQMVSTYQHEQTL